MTTIVLIDDTKNWKNLLPFTYTKPISYLRFGILTIKEKWEKHLNAKVKISSENYLNDMFPNYAGDSAIFVSSIVCPDINLLNQLQNLKEGEGLFFKDDLIAVNGSKQNFIEKKCVAKQIDAAPIMIHHVWDLFQKNSIGINSDFELLTKGRTSEKLSESNTVIGDKHLVFLEKGAIAEACIFNTCNGPIYLAKDSEVMEGSVIRGPFSLGESSVLKLSTKIYGATTIGPQCKVGGEVNNSVIFGYTNKAHDGFLGNSVLGEWCNLGADTNNSNLKNNYGNVKLYNYLHGKMIDTGLQFCGLMMGDYSKSGINTMFNTGTVVGVGVNVYGGGFPSSYIPNFSWGGADGFEAYDLAKLIETNKRVYERRQMEFGEKEVKLLQHVLKISLE